MPFFFVLPLWLFAAIVSIVMILLPATRRLGIYLFMMSTSAMIVSFVLAYVVLFAGMWLAAASGVDWLRFFALGGYLGAIPIGGLLGALAGFVITRRLLAFARRRS